LAPRVTKQDSLRNGQTAAQMHFSQAKRYVVQHPGETIASHQQGDTMNNSPAAANVV